MKHVSRPFGAKHDIRSQRGFTVVELMVAIAIMAILAAVAVPAVQEMVAAGRVRHAASALYESLMIARSEALKRNTTVTFVYSDAGVGLSSGWRLDTPDPETVHSQTALTNLTFVPAAPAFQFSATGRMTGGGSVAITGAGTTTARWVCIVNSTRPSIRLEAC